MSVGDILGFLPWEHPWALLGLAACLLPVAIRAWARRRGRRVAIASTLLQCLTLAAAVAALAGPRMPQASRQDWLVLHDVSASMRMQDDLPLPADTPRQDYTFADSLNSGRPSTAVRSGHRTLLAPALGLAEQSNLAGLILHTDGQYQDQVDAAARDIAQRKLPLYIVPARRPPADAGIADLSVRQDPQGRRTELAVTITANARQRRVLQVLREQVNQTGGEAILLQRPLELLEGDVVTIHAADASRPAGVLRYRAVLSAGDAFTENDTAAAIVPPVDRRVAVVSATPLPTMKFPGTIDVLTPQDLPRHADALQAYDAILAMDPTGRLLAPAGDALAAYVRSGGGLVLLGTGPFGSPADAATPLARVLPLLTNPYQRRPMKLIVALDASGSMSETTTRPGRGQQLKYAIAAEAVLSLQAHLTANDRLAVIVFANQPRRVYDSGDRPPDFAALKQALDAVQPAGGTAVLPALEAATEKPDLAGRAGLVILLSDLRTESFDAAAMARRLRQAGLSLSVAAVVSGQSPSDQPPLQRLSREMNGPLVNIQTLEDLARVFAEFLRQGRGDAMRHGSFRFESSRDFFGRSITPPPVTDYFLTAPQEGATVLARAGEDPLVATRTVGLGRAVSIALPLSATHNAAWAASPELPRLLEAAVSWSARSAASSEFSATVTRRGDEILVELTGMSQAGPLNLAEVTANLLTVQDDQPHVRRLAMAQTGPGRYELRTPADGAAAIHVTDPNGRVLWRGLLPELASEEFQHVGPDEAKLRRLAEMTGGRIVSAQELPELLREQYAAQLAPLWWAPAMAAVLFMLAEWALTRVRRE